MRVKFAFFLFIATGICGAQTTFEKLLGEFQQRKSPVCVIYGHAIAIAESAPEILIQSIKPTEAGWSVTMADGLAVIVRKADLDLSFKNNYLAGQTDNLLSILCVAVSKHCGGYNFETGMLDYGKRDYAKFMGSGKWTLYDDGQGPGRMLSDGLDRLIRETKPDGSLKTPSTLGFGDLSSEEAPEYIRNFAKQHRLISGHDFSVSGYDPKTGEMLLRNPHNPKELIRIPVDLMRQLPAGIDFMEPAGEGKKG